MAPTPAERSVTAPYDGEFSMTVSEVPVKDESTFHEPAFILRLTRPVGGGEAPILTLPLRSSLTHGTDVLRSAIVLARAREACAARPTSLAQTTPEERVAIARAEVRRHGWASVWIDSQRFETPFVHDWGFAVVYPEGAQKPTFDALLDEVPRPSSLPLRTEFQTRRVKASIHMKESWAPWAGGWPFSGTLGNLAALLDPFTHQGVDNIKDLIHLLWVDAGAYSSGVEVACISELRIHSHGCADFICMGDDRIRASDFGANGAVTPGTAAETLINALKKIMCKPSTIIFDACHAGDGNLLRNISKNLGPDVRVKGFTGIGNPITDGNVTYANGARV